MSEGKKWDEVPTPNPLTDPTVQSQSLRLGPDGKQMIGTLLPGALEQEKAMIANELSAQGRPAFERETELADERIAALEAVIADAHLLERTQLAELVIAYATDCQERSIELEKSGNRERKRLRKTGHLTEAEEIKIMQDNRSSAYRVRAAIAADIAHKIETGWGRNDDGTVMEKVDVDNSDIQAAVAKLKVVPKDDG